MHYTSQNCIMHNALSSAKCIGFNALCILIFLDFSIFSGFSRFWTNKFTAFSLFYCKFAKVSSEMPSKTHDSRQKQRRYVMANAQRFKNQKLEQPIVKYKSKGLSKKNLRKFLCKHVLRFFSKSFSADAFFEGFAPEISLQMFCSQIFL